MTKQEMLDWIDRATYEQLLRKNRFAPIGDPFFQGDVGKYFGDVMNKKRLALTHEEVVAISKQIGWN